MVNTQFGTVNQLDNAIAQTIYDCNITIPITYINDRQYLIGPEKKNCLMKNDTAFVTVGGGVERFDEFVPRNQRQYQKKLVKHMIHNNQSLEWVTDQLAAGKNITSSGVNAPYAQSPTNKKGKSPNRSPTRKPGASPSRPSTGNPKLSGYKPSTPGLPNPTSSPRRPNGPGARR